MSTTVVQARLKATDMRKHAMIPGSPDMTMSPAWINNRLEHFQGIGKMIGRRWRRRRRRGRRSSHRIRELMEKFGEGGRGMMSVQDSQLEGRERLGQYDQHSSSSPSVVTHTHSTSSSNDITH